MFRHRRPPAVDSTVVEGKPHRPATDRRLSPLPPEELAVVDIGMVKEVPPRGKCFVKRQRLAPRVTVSTQLWVEPTLDCDSAVADAFARLGALRSQHEALSR